MGSETTRRMVIIAVCSGMSQPKAARTYGVSQSWVSRLMARYRLEGQAAYTPRSTRPPTPARTKPAPRSSGLTLTLWTPELAG